MASRRAHDSFLQLRWPWLDAARHTSPSFRRPTTAMRRVLFRFAASVRPSVVAWRNDDAAGDASPTRSFNIGLGGPAACRAGSRCQCRFRDPMSNLHPPQRGGVRRVCRLRSVAGREGRGLTMRDSPLHLMLARACRGMLPAWRKTHPLTRPSRTGGRASFRGDMRLKNR